LFRNNQLVPSLHNTITLTFCYFIHNNEKKKKKNARTRMNMNKHFTSKSYIQKL
uniref:Ovule protein n=1 Tax=Brugia timori TaxID=42155 RepID=A0A0R3QU59_9BILA